MDDFHQHFLGESAAKLRKLAAELSGKKNLADRERANVFRVLHTIKGTSQTFGLNAAGELAGRLESLLNSPENESGNSIAALCEGIDLLVRCLEEQDTVVSREFCERIPGSAPDVDEPAAAGEMAGIVPPEMFGRLSPPEKRSLLSELRRGKRLIGLEIGFGLADFASGLREFRSLIDAEATVIATFPAGPPTDPDGIRFQMLAATHLPADQILGLVHASGARILFDSPPAPLIQDVESVISYVVAHGRDVAARSGKAVNFEVSADVPGIQPVQLRLIFEVLLHTVRNAVDHAIEDQGTIAISLEETPDALTLIVSDNGRGIDPEVMRRVARARMMIPEGEILSDAQALELVFRSEFSTAAAVTEISGRGVGLDAVRSALDKAGGTISIRSEAGQGTSFEVFLPK